jgi:DNA-binding protein HU-beta
MFPWKVFVVYFWHHLPLKENNNMNKAVLVEKLSSDAGITKAQAETTLKSFVEAVAKTAKKDGKLSLVGFGTFSLAKRKARKGRNPKTGEAIKIKASKSVKFTAGKNLKAAL